MFNLHPLLQKDTIFIKSLNLCNVVLMNDSRYPWLILVPEREDISEIHHLENSDQLLLFREIIRISKTIENYFVPHKINIAALGNEVKQLHIHIIARYKEDFAWPGPVWGNGDPVSYDSQLLKKRFI